MIDYTITKLELTGVIFETTILINLPLWIIGIIKKYNIKNYIYYCPFIPAAFWTLLVMAGTKSQNLLNIIEIPVINIFTMLTCTTLIFIRPQTFNSSKQKKILIVIFLIFTILIRILMPLIPL